MKKTSLLAMALLAVGRSALAQPSVGAGGQLQQIPPVPGSPRSIPDLRIERSRPQTSPEPSGTKILLQTLHVTGATRFTEAQLVAAAGFQPGSELDLAGLRAMAARISDFYNRQGYFLAQAYLPAQDIQNGAVTIAVVEGRYGEVALNNSTNVSTDLAHGILAGLDTGDLVANAPLERRLLLLSDLPGVLVNSTLSPGGAVGTSDLVVDLIPGRRVTGRVEADNAGNRYTGEYRGGGSINFNEPLGRGDVASLRFLTSGSGLNYVRGSYQAQVRNLTLGVAYAHLGYQLGREFTPLNASGTTEVTSVYAGYPLYRSRDTNLKVLAELDARRFQDKVGATSSVTDKSARVLSAGLAGDHHDRLGGDGWTLYSINWTSGDLDIKTPLARAIDELTARTNGSYNKVAFQVSRLQALDGPLSFYGAARGQIASKNLDSSEKMELGGAYGVRAYPEGEAFGDQGYILTAESRLRLGRTPGPGGGQVQAVAFIDDGSVTLNKSPWAAGPNRRSLSAAGVGLIWADNNNFTAKVSYAFKLGNGHATSAPDRSGRLWVQVSKNF